MTTSKERRRLREAIAARSDVRQRLSNALRTQAAAYAMRRKAEGASAASVAKELGVSQPTVGRWLERSSSASTTTASKPATLPRAMREVVVETGAARGLRVASPAGYRVEGLSLEEAAMLLRALG